MAAKSNQKINAILAEHKEKFGYISTIFEYQFGKGGPKLLLLLRML